MKNKKAKLKIFNYNLVKDCRGWIRIVEAKKNPLVLFEFPLNTERRFLIASGEIASFNEDKKQ